MAVTLREHLVRGVAGSLGLTVVSAGLAFVIGVLLARLLGAAGIGVYASVIAVVLILTDTMTLGFERLIVRDVAARGGRGEWATVRGLLQRSVQIVVLAAVTAAAAFGVAGWLMGDVLHDDYVVVLWLGLAIVPLSDLVSLRQSFALGLHQIVNAQLPDSVVRPGLFALMLLAVLATGQDADPALAMALDLVATLAALAIGLAMLVPHLPAALLRSKPRFETRRWIAQAVPFTLLIAVQTLILHADVVLVAAISGPEAAGLYAVAARGAGLVIFGAAAVAVTVGPTAARLWDQGDLPRLRLAVTRGARGALVFALLVSAALILFADQFLALFGPEFTSADSTLVLLAIGQLVAVAFGLGGVLLNMTGRQMDALGAAVAAAVIRVGGGLLLIPAYGPNGAAIAAIASLAAFNGLMAVATIRRLRVDPTPLGFSLRR